MAMTWKKVPPSKLREPDLVPEDFIDVLKTVKPSVSQKEIERCQQWTEEFGSEGA